MAIGTTWSSSPYKNAVVLQHKLIKGSQMKIYPGFPHGMLTTEAATTTAAPMVATH